MEEKVKRPEDMTGSDLAIVLGMMVLVYGAMLAIPILIVAALVKYLFF